MRDLNKQGRNAIETVAKLFSATCEKGSDPPDAYIIVAGKRIAVDIATLKWRSTLAVNANKPRLRFDRVATRLIERLQGIGEAVPDGMTVLLTITAPIRLPSKTAAGLEGKIHTVLRRESRSRDEKITIHGNRVQIRVLGDAPERAPKMVGFVHNPDSDPLLILNMTRELLERISVAEAGVRATRLTGVRWLVFISAGDISWLEVYRYIYSQRRMATDFEKIFMVFGDGRVGILTG